MKKIFIYLVFLFPFLLQSQEWNESVISNFVSSSSQADFCVDTNGVIHCVWSSQHGFYYSNSSDDGNTWSTPIKKFENTAPNNPHISCDSKNNLYIVFDGGPYLVTFNGTNWSDPIRISDTSMHFTNNNNVVIDNNDRIYIFWNYNSRFYYRYYENNQLSEIFCPYSDYNWYNIRDVSVDNDNNIHIIGSYRAAEMQTFAHSYYRYDYANNSWSDVVLLSAYNHYSQFSSIYVDKENHIHCVWGDLHNYPADTRTHYSFNNGSEWSSVETVGNNYMNAMQPSFTMDINNVAHIVKIEYDYQSGMYLFHYKKLNNNWEKETISTDPVYSLEYKLLSYKNKLFLLYSEMRDNTTTLIFKKAEIPLSMSENLSANTDSPVLNQNYPNPCSKSTKINFELETSGQTSLTIYDIQGKVVSTLIDGYKEAGNYSVDWDLTDKNVQKASQGIYYYCLQTDKYKQTKSIIIE